MSAHAHQQTGSATARVHPETRLRMQTYTCTNYSSSTKQLTKFASAASCTNCTTQRVAYIVIGTFSLPIYCGFLLPALISCAANWFLITFAAFATNLCITAAHLKAFGVWCLVFGVRRWHGSIVRMRRCLARSRHSGS